MSVTTEVIIKTQEMVIIIVNLIQNWIVNTKLDKFYENIRYSTETYNLMIHEF